MEKVLVVDDEESMRDILTTWLEEDGYTALSSSTGTEAMKEIYEHRPDLVVSDVMMPEMDGIKLCSLASEVSDAPVILLTALGKEQEKVRGFEAGADEYIVKPVGMGEFLARVRAVLRRKTSKSSAQGKNEGYADSILRIDVDRHEVWIGGELVDFTPTEFRLLQYLTDRADKACKLQEILASVWGSPHYPLDVIKWHIGRIRSKIEEIPRTPNLLLSLRGVGYRYRPPATDEGTFLP